MRTLKHSGLLAMLVCAMAVSSGANARLVIIQDDAARAAEREANRLKEQELMIRKQELEVQQQETARIEAVQNATVPINDENLNIVADRTEKIIHHYGVPPASLAPQGGAGLGSPLWISLNSIIPNGWRVFSDKGIDSQKPVSWNGHEANWVAILYTLGVQHRLVFDVDWNQQVVVVRPRTSSLDYLRDEFDKNNAAQEVNLTIQLKPGEAIPEGGEGVLVVNGQAMKVTRAYRPSP